MFKPWWRRCGFPILLWAASLCPEPIGRPPPDTCQMSIQPCQLFATSATSFLVWIIFSTNQDWISQTVTFPNLSGRPFGTHRPVCGPWPEALIYKRQISIKSVESFLSFFNLFLFVNYILPLGGVVISSPNYINLLLKEFSWVSLFFRSAMQFW